MASVIVKENDTRPTRFTLLDRVDTADPQIVSLVDADSLVFIMRHARGPGRPLKVDRQPITVLDAADGLVQYEWDASDTDDPGAYFAEIEVTWDDGTVSTFPTNGYIYVEIQGDLG